MTKLITISVREENLPIFEALEKVRTNKEPLSSFLFEKCGKYYLESLENNKCPSITASLPEWKRFLSSLEKEKRLEFNQCLNRLVMLEKKEFLSRL